MKTALIKFGVILLIAASIIGCASENVNHPLYSDLKNAEKNGADIWSSIHYQVVTDKDEIKKVAPASDDDSILIAVLIKLENKGPKRAEAFQANFYVPVPFTHTNGSGHQGIDHGYLDTNEKYEIFQYYSFKAAEDIEAFIAKANVIVEWKEDGENKKLILKLPGKPTE